LNITIYPSDFGKERMALEEKFGPQGIWQKESEEMKKNNYQPEMEFGSEEEEDDEEDEGEEEEEEEDGDEDEENEDEEQEGDKEESGDDDHSQDNDNSDDEEKPPRKNSAHQNKGTDSKKKKKTTDYDQIALRQYELSKLRYYFAIADCDSIETANVLYEQLDDVEMGDSGMVFEMRFVPDDLDLSSRDVSSTCSVIPHNYKPPEFVINALQSTNVECSWDEGEKDREKKLTNISSWRSLKESEFMQYIASSDSEDYEDDSNAEHSHSEEENSEEDEESEEEKPRKSGRPSKKMQQQQLGSGGSVGSSGSMKSLKKKKKAKNLRALLLGDHSAGADEDEEDEEKNINEDDFFAQGDNHSGSESNESDEEKNQKKKKTKKISKKGSAQDMDLPPMDENGEITFSYVPEADAQEEKEASLEGLTPYEIELKKSSERKKQRKQDRKQVVEGLQQNQAEALKKIQDDLKKKKKKQILEEDEQEFNDEDRLVHQLKPWEVERQASNEKKRQKLEKKLKKKKHSGFEEAVEDDGSHKNNKIGAEAEVDVTDERFRRIFEGSDSNFGIDRTFNEFKETKGMKTILQEQKKRREIKGKANASTDNTNNGTTDKQEISSLANKLKRKFSAAN
jgi:hypothetical protein